MTILKTRRIGISGHVAIKVPCRVATSAPIVLNGLQEIDGLDVVQDDRVLVKDQSNPVENGIYLADSGIWQRALDFNGPYDVVQGSLVIVVAGSLYTQSVWELSTVAPIIGTSGLAFTILPPALNAASAWITANLLPALTQEAAREALGAADNSQIRSETGAVVVTLPSILQREIWVEDFGALGDGTTNDTTAINLAHAAAEATGLRLRFMSGKNYLYTGPMNITPEMGGIDGAGATLTSTGASTDCFFFGSGNFDSGDLCHLPNVVGYSNGAAIRLRGTANADIYCHHIYSCQDGFLSETTAAAPNTINNRFRFMKIGVCSQAGIHLKAGVDGVTGHQSQQGLKVEGNFIQGNKYAIYCDFAANQTAGMNDIEIDVDGLEGANLATDSIIGTTHGTTTIDGIASTVGLVPGPICGPGVDVGTTFTISGPNSILLSAAATSSTVSLFYTNDHRGFYCPTGAMNGPWLVRAREFMGGFGDGDIIVPDNATGLDFECGWPASPAYGAIQCDGSNTFKNTFNQGSVIGIPIACKTASNSRATFNSGMALGYNRLYLTAPLNPAGVSAGTTVTVYAYSPLLSSFSTPLRITPMFNKIFSVLSVFDDSDSGSAIPHQIRIDLYCHANTGATPPEQEFYLEVGA